MKSFTGLVLVLVLVLLVMYNNVQFVHAQELEIKCDPDWSTGTTDFPIKNGWVARYPRMNTHVGIIVNCSKAENFKLSQCYIIMDEFAYETLHDLYIKHYNSLILAHTHQLVYEPFSFEDLNKINFVAKYYCDYSTMYVAHDIDETALEAFNKAAHHLKCKISKSANASGALSTVVSMVFVTLFALKVV